MSNKLDSVIKIASMPMKIAWCDIEENLHHVSTRLCAVHPDTDILVLPELFSTGFVQDASVIKDIALEHGARTIGLLHTWSKQYSMAIAGSFLATDGKNMYNRAFFIEPSGDETFYDKRHLFCLSPEATMFANGATTPPVIRFRGWNISIIVCYDIRFPVWCRNKNTRYDILLVPANWPVARGYAWKQLLIGRAIENQSIVVGANRAGRDDYGVYDFLSYIVDADGHITATTECEDCADRTDSDRIIYSTFRKSDIEKIRSKLPVGKDADDYEITIQSQFPPID